MGIEVEVKYRAADQAGVADRLAGLGAAAVASFEQADAYYAHPARDFAQTGEAFRLRCDDHGDRLTYKGPKWGGPAKTREEIEVPLAGGPAARDDMARLLDRLGFRPVATVRKSRTAHRLAYQDIPMEVVLDRVEGLGTFVEVEAIAGTEVEVPRAQAAVLALAGELGLSEVEPRSYLRMALGL